MKRWILALGICLALASPSFAAVGIQSNGTNKGAATDINFGTDFVVSGNGSVQKIVLATTSGPHLLNWAPPDFAIAQVPLADNNFSYTPLSTSTTPSLSMKASRVTGYIKWDQNTPTPIQKTFKVPADYKSGAQFRALLGRSDSDGGNRPPAINYAVYVNQTNTAFVTTYTAQTAVTLSAANGGGSPEEKTLTVATDFANLAAGQYVTVNVWRDSTVASADDLELYYLDFYYSNT